MNYCGNSCGTRLPDITRCAGDTTPLRVYLVKDNGNKYSGTELANITGKLTMKPYVVATGLAGTTPTQPVLTISGAYSTDDNGYAVMLFEFTTSDTKNMMGKFLYQIELTHDNDPDEVRVSQGFCTINGNIDIQVGG